MRREGEPPNRIGLVADLANPLWERIVVDPRYRCLIPLTYFANSDGVKGAKTRSWFSSNRQPLMAWAGFAKNTPDFGPVFAGMTMTANEKIRPFNDRMARFARAARIRPLASWFDRRCYRLPVSRSAVFR